MNINWNLVIVLVALIIFCIIFRDSLSKLIERITKFSFRRKKKNTETEIVLNADISDEEDSKEEQIEVTVEEINDEAVEENLDYASIYQLLKKSDFENAESAYTKLMSETPETVDQLNLERFYLYFSYYFGKDKNFEKYELLKHKCNKNIEELGKTIYNIGLLYHIGDDKENAKKCYEECYSLDISDDLKSKVIVSHSKLFDKEYEKSIKFLEQKYSTINNRESKYSIIFRMFELLSENGDERADYLLEKSIYDANNNHEKLFDIAYNHKSDLVSAYVYNKILYIRPEHSSALNNLGVAYGVLKINISSIKCYKKSLKNGISLAAANIANKLINAGFEDEALEYLNTEKKKDKYHENVDHHLSRLHKEDNNETDKKEKLEKNAIIRIDYMNENALSFIKKIDSNSLAGKEFKCEKNSIIFYKKDDGIEFQYIESGTYYKKDVELRNYAFYIELKNTDNLLTIFERKFWISIHEDFSELDILFIQGENEYKRAKYIEIE